jgi:hypothetical protein
MLTTRHYWIDPSAEADLRALGWAKYAVLMGAELGREIKSKDGPSVRRLKADGLTTEAIRGRILKRSHRPPIPKWRQLARSIKRRERPHCETFHVSMVAAQLTSRHFAVMRVVAAGETRLLGFWPLEAFVLAELVPGTDASLMYTQGPAEEWLGMPSARGSLMARLHSDGFFFTLWLHDVFCQFVGLAESPRRGRDARLTLIDLDSKGRPARSETSTVARRALALGKTCHKSLRSGLRLDVSGLAAWWRAYHRSLPVAARGVSLRQVHVHTRGLMARHHADATTAAVFPDALAVDHPSLHPPSAARARIDDALR